MDGSVEGRKLYQNGTRRTASGRGRILLQSYYSQSSPLLELNSEKMDYNLPYLLLTELDSQGRLIDTDKWDNHNAIARGFSRDNYHPVTFRKIYGVEKQAPTPVPMMRQPTPSSQPPPQQVIPTEEPEAVSDL